MLTWANPFYAACTWMPPEPIIAEPSVDPVTHRVYLTMELGHLRRKVRIPMGCPTKLIHERLFDHAMQLLAQADYPPSALELAGIKFENAVAEMGGRG